MADTIDTDLMQQATEHVRANKDSVIHTVTLTLNGAHGGVDLTIEGFVDDSIDIPFAESIELH